MSTDFKNDTNTAKYGVLKYTLLVSSLLFSVFMFFSWFEIGTFITQPEDHSLLTIPGLIVQAVDAIKNYIGNGATFTILLTVGALEYLCIVSAALGIWGTIRTLTQKRRSRILFAAQITALCLIAITITIIIIVSFISNKLLGGIVSMTPKIWLVLSLVFLTVSIVTGFYYNRIYGNISE